jgi:hypothetical protein
MKTFIVLFGVVFLCFALTSCAPGPNVSQNTPTEKGAVAGFWLGLWHGIIAPVTFVISLFSRNIHLYEVHNNGGWYNFGFILGLSIIFGGSAGGSARRVRRTR